MNGVDIWKDAAALSHSCMDGCAEIVSSQIIRHQGWLREPALFPQSFPHIRLPAWSGAFPSPLPPSSPTFFIFLQGLIDAAASNHTQNAGQQQVRTHISALLFAFVCVVVVCVLGSGKPIPNSTPLLHQLPRTLQAHHHIYLFTIAVTGDPPSPRFCYITSSP